MISNKTKNFKELIVWQRAHEFVLNIYDLTSNFPKEEIYGLIPQFRRAAISIAANIAEGYKKRSKKDKLRFLNIAEGSLEECQYYLVLSKDLKYGFNKEISIQLNEIGKMLTKYSKVIKTDV